MPDFSTILQAPEIRALVQENLLERAFHDALYPRLMFRGEVEARVWPQNAGDTHVFTGVGLIKKKLKPLTPGQDPQPSTYPVEQWIAQINQYADTIDTHMPTSIAAIASLFYRNAQQLGMSGAQSLNALVRNRMYATALSGHTVADGVSTTTALRVKRLNGFTRARRPDLAAGSPVMFSTVSGSNPLKIKLFDNAVEVANTVVGYTADTPGDEVGPGVLTLGTTSTSVADRAYVIADDRTALVRVGGGFKIDDVGSGDLFTLAAIRSAVARFQQQNVPERADGRFHCHMDPTSVTQVFADAEFQRLLTSLPDYFMYKQFALGELLGCVFFRNSECPQPDTVDGGLTAAYSADDPFAGELFNNGVAATGVKVHRPLFSGEGGIFEYYQDLGQLITEAGITGKVAESRITNNGIEILSDRIQLIIRAPMNRLQDSVSTSWKFIGDWPCRTDAAVGDAARYKRLLTVEHGE